MKAQCGICCPKHPAARLIVKTTRKVAVGIVVRYRKCSKCGWTVPTEERVRTPRTKARAG